VLADWQRGHCRGGGRGSGGWPAPAFLLAPCLGGGGGAATAAFRAFATTPVVGTLMMPPVAPPYTCPCQEQEHTDRVISSYIFSYASLSGKIYQSMLRSVEDVCDV